MNDLKIFESKCTELQNKLNLTTQESDRYRERLRVKTEEFDELRKKLQEADAKLREIHSYEVQLKEYESKVSFMTKEIERLNEVLRLTMEESERYMESYRIMETRVTCITKYEGD